MKKELTQKERYALADKLESILVADLDEDEISAIEQAIAIISPEYVEDREKDEREAVEEFEKMTDEDFAKLDEEIASMLKENEKPSAPNVIPFPKGGK